MEPQNYTVKEVKGVFEAQFGKKVNFTVQEYQHDLSVFTKYPDNMQVGRKIYGHIEVNGQYHNFKFSKEVGGVTPKSVDPLIQKIYQEVYACRQEIVILRQLLQAQGVLDKPQPTVAGTQIPYPESTGPTAFDDVKPEDINFEDLPFN